MSSCSTSSTNFSGVHLNINFGGTELSDSRAKILPPTLKQRSSPHCRFSVAWGKERQKRRMDSTLIVFADACGAEVLSQIYSQKRTHSRFCHSGRARLQSCRIKLYPSRLEPLGYAVKPTRLMSPHGTYFVTFITSQRRRLFAVEPYVRLFLKIMYKHRREGKFQLHSFVLMPEHVHLLLTPANGVT